MSAQAMQQANNGMLTIGIDLGDSGVPIAFWEKTAR